MPAKKHAPTEEDSSTTPIKIARIGGPARTAQACDRCKSRKIRCDGTEGGCMPCRQNNTECRTTDRLTNRATVRGHTETIERENSILRQRMNELEQQLRDAGLEPKSAPPYIPAKPSSDRTHWTDHPDAPAANDHTAVSTFPSSAAASDANDIDQLHLPHRNGSPTDATSSRAYEANLFMLPAFRSGSTGDNYLGVSADNDLLSPIKGTSLSVFGMHINLADIFEGGVDDPASLTSFQTLANSVRKTGPSAALGDKATLPTEYQQYVEYANMYFMAINPWLPFLHRPSFMQLVSKIYSGQQATCAETVQMHMVLAIIKYQIATRNFNAPDHATTTEQSFAHYHYSLSFLTDLSVSRTLADIQAVGLICAHVRGFPKPGPSFLFMSYSFNLAIEMGLHRSTSAWANSAQKLSKLDVEIRKRVFWTLLLMLVCLNGRLGRPMPIRLDDFDVELPDSLNDDMVAAEPGVDPIQYSVWGSIELFKLAKIYLETYNYIYAIKQQTGAQYEATVQRLEAKLEAWRKQLPDLISGASTSSTDPNSKLFSNWMQAWGCEYELALHHPALCRSQNEDFMKRNLIKCIDAAYGLIAAQKRLWMDECLDTTWPTVTAFIGGVFTLLFAHWERKEQVTSSEMAKLKEHMDVSLDVFGDLSLLLGSGPRLRDSIQQIVENGLARLNRYLAEKTASAAVASEASIKQSPTQSSAPASTSAGRKQPKKSEPRKKTKTFGKGSDHQPKNASTSQKDSDKTTSAPITSYSGTTDPVLIQDTRNIHYAPAGNSSHSQTDYMHGLTNGSDQALQYNPYSQPTPDHSSYAMTQAISGSNSQHPQAPHMSHSNNQAPFVFNDAEYNGTYGGPMAWRQWIEATKNPLDAQDYMTSATNALMSMSNRNDHQSATAATAVAIPQQQQHHHHHHHPPQHHHQHSGDGTPPPGQPQLHHGHGTTYLATAMPSAPGAPTVGWPASSVYSMNPQMHQFSGNSYNRSDT